MQSPSSRILAHFKTHKFLYLSIIFTYIFSVLCRFYWAFWASDFELFKFNEQLMITSNDGYAFAEGARDMIAGFHQPNDLSFFGSPLSTLTAYIYAISPFSFETIILYMSVFLSSFLVVPILLIARLYNAQMAGLFAALTACVAHSYYNRTMAGYFDTDMLTIVLPTLLAYCMIRLVLKKDAISLIFTPLVMSFYLWWYPSSFTLNAAFLGLLLVYTLIFHRPFSSKENRVIYLALVLCLIMLSPVPWYVNLAILALLFALWGFKNELFSLKFIAFLGVLAFIFVALNGGFDAILAQLRFYIFRQDLSASVQSFSYFNVASTIQEASTIGLSLFMRRILSSEIAFLVGCFGLILLLKKHKSAILLLPLLMLGFLALRGGLRFTIYAVPVLALGFGWAISWILSQIQNAAIEHKFKQILSIFCVILALFLSLGFAFYHIYTYTAQSVFARDEVSVLDRLKNIASREDYVVSWWDYGYPVRYYADVKTLADGGKHLGNDNFFPSFILSANEHAAANMSRLAVEYTERKFSDKNDSLLQSDLLKAMLRDYEFNATATDATLFLNALQKPSFSLKTPKSRDVFIYMPVRMAMIFSTVASFSKIDLATGEINQPLIFSTAIALGSLNDGSYLLSNQMRLSSDFTTIFLGESDFKIHSFFEFDSIKNRDFKQILVDENSEIFVLYLKESFNAPFNLPIQFIIMDKSMFESTFVQMLFFKNYNEKLFELVIDEKDARVYKLKR